MERLADNTKRLNKNLDVLLKFTKRPKTPEITLKNMAFFEENQLFAGSGWKRR